MNEDCFAFIGKHKNPPCSCLEELVCDGKKCSFYKTKKQFNIDLAAINGTTDLRVVSKQYSDAYNARHPEKFYEEY